MDYSGNKDVRRGDELMRLKVSAQVLFWVGSRVSVDAVDVVVVCCRQVGGPI